jgi:agmatine/peptidylarginine deiminase
MRPVDFRSLTFIGFNAAILTAAAFGGWTVGHRSPQPASTSRGTGGFGPALAPAEGARMPAEFERHDALMLGLNELVDLHPQTLVDIVRAIDGRIEILGLIARPEQERATLELLEAHGVATDNVRFFLWPATSMWLQDFGPQQLVNGDVRVIDFEYDYTGREQENLLPMAFAATFDMQIAHSKLTLEGGNFLSNGRGWCISSAAMIDANRARQYDVATIGRILNEDLRFTQWSYLMPLVGESTAHLDMFLTIADPSTVVLASYDPQEDPVNAARMDDSARVLAAEKVDGKPVRVVRLPSPAARDGIWRTYTNVIYANGVLLVPQYPDFSP